MSVHELEIRLAQATDAPEILEWFGIVGSETEFLSVDESGLSQTEEELQAFLEQVAERDNEVCLLALIDEDLAGLVLVTADQRFRVAHIGDFFIAVKQAYWGHGLGQALMEETLHWAREYSSLRRLQLTVQARNRGAIHLYEKMGFAVEGRQERGAQLRDGSFVDVILMGQLIDWE